jgi:hypothetical protein
MANVAMLKPINRKTLGITIEGTSLLVQHAWSEKAREMMRAKKGGKKTKERSVCDPQAEAEAATYRTADGQFGVPLNALKASFISAAHKDIGIEKTLVRKSLFVLCSDPGGVLPMRCAEPVIREDNVRVGQGSADLRYRPQFTGWECDVEIEYDADNLTTDDIVNLINRAGFGVGICEFRPEKGGDWGRYQVKTKKTK